MPGGDAAVGLVLRRALPAALVAAIAALAASPAGAAPIALGAYMPGASDDPGLIDRFARQTGRAPVIVNSYKDWSSLPFDRAELESVSEAQGRCR